MGEPETCRSSHGIKTSDFANSVISAGDWHLEPGVYDLTKEKYAAVPMVDLQSDKKMEAMP